jgi:hypothetical protein
LISGSWEPELPPEGSLAVMGSLVVVAWRLASWLVVAVVVDGFDGIGEQRGA